MTLAHKEKKSNMSMITLYHDIEQDFNTTKAEPERCRLIVKEFLKIEKKYNIPVTYNIVGKLFKEQPDLIDWIVEAGQEVAFHSYTHRADPKKYASEIDMCSKVSPLPRGYRSPISSWDETTLKSLWERKFLWNAEGDKHDEPYFIYKGLVRLPIAGDDWLLYRGIKNVATWVESFADLLNKKS